MDNLMQITLKNGILKPTSVLLNISELGPLNYTGIVLRLSPDNKTQLYKYSNLTTARKYIFMIEETQQETDALTAGEQHIFNNFGGYKTGKYHLVCINYPKISCQIEIINDKNEQKQSQEMQIMNQRKSNTIINISGLESVQEKQQQNKEDFGKDDNQQVKSQQMQEQNPLGTPKKAQLQDYDKILTSQTKIKEETAENKYLRYFQEQFKIWRNFFEQKQNQKQQQEQEQVKQQSIQKQQIKQQDISQALDDIYTPTKQKPKSEHRKNSDGMIEQNKMDNWSKRQNYSPDLKYTMSCGSPSNNQNFSEFQKQQDGTVLSLLHSQQNYCTDYQLQKQTKTMKKTNSQYRLNIQDVGQKRDSQTDTASKKKQKKYKKGKSFLQWLDLWAQNQNPIYLKQKQDQYLIKQWLSHLQNKHKIAKFIYN